MKPNRAKNRFRTAIIPILALGMSTAIAQGPPPGHGPDHGQDHGQGRGNAYGHDKHDNGHDGRENGPDFRFQDDHRARFESHYHKDVDRWRQHPDRRPRFERGQRIPTTYVIRPVPRNYYVNVPPPPPGYQYGYYDGYVVAYNPTTRIIADVLDLVAAATR